MSSAAPPLSSIYFYLTEGCNLACRHCWLAPKFDPKADKYAVLPVDIFEQAIAEAKELGLASVKLTGGEPLMHPRIADLLEIVRREGLELIIETNGVLCTTEIAAEIAKSPERFVSVSLDGAGAETHDRIRGVGGSFDKAVRGMKNLAASENPPQVIMSIMEENIGEVEAVIALAEEVGAGSVKFNVIQPTGRGERMAGRDTIDAAAVLTLGRRIENELAQKTDIKLFFDYPLAFRPLSRLAADGGCSVCGIHGIIGVLPTGEYALCGIGGQVKDLVFGEVGNDPLEEVWNDNPVLKELREGLPEQLGGVCGRCLMKSRCLGSCLAQNYYRTGSLWSPFWFCEEAERAGIFPESRLTDVPVTVES